MSKEKVRIPTKQVADNILGKEIVGIGAGQGIIEIEVRGHKVLIFKLNELDENGDPTIYLKDYSDEMKVDGF